MHEMLLRVWTSVSFPVLPSLHSLPFCLLKVETVPSRVCSSETKRNEDGFFSIKQKKGFEKTLSNFSLPSKKTFDSKSNLWLIHSIPSICHPWIIWNCLEKLRLSLPFLFFFKKSSLNNFEWRRGAGVEASNFATRCFSSRMRGNPEKRGGERGEGTRIFVLTFWSRWEGG